MQPDTRRRSDIDLSASATPAPQVLFQELDGEAVLLNLESESYFGLDDVGTRIWQLLVEHAQLGRVYAQMQKEYDVEEDRLRRDILQLVAKLDEAGLITVETKSDDVAPGS